MGIVSIVLYSVNSMPMTVMRAYRMDATGVLVMRHVTIPINTISMICIVCKHPARKNQITSIQVSFSMIPSSMMYVPPIYLQTFSVIHCTMHKNGSSI